MRLLPASAGRRDPIYRVPFGYRVRCLTLPILSKTNSYTPQRRSINCLLASKAANLGPGHNQRVVG